MSDANITEPRFSIDGAECSLTEAMDANADDVDVCEWLRTANVGDRYPAFVETIRVA